MSLTPNEKNLNGAGLSHLISIIKTYLPQTYLKSATASNNTLTLTNQDNTTVTYTPTTPNASTVTVGGLTIRLNGNTLYIRNDGGEA